MKSFQAFLSQLISKNKPTVSEEERRAAQIRVDEWRIIELRNAIRYFGLDDAKWFDGLDRQDVLNLISLEECFGSYGLQREKWNERIHFYANDGTQIHPEDIIGYCLSTDTKLEKSEFLGRLITVLTMREFPSIVRMNHYLPTVTYLLEQGADINVMDSQPLHVAVQVGYPQYIIKPLIDLGARPTQDIMNSIESVRFEHMWSKMSNNIPALQASIRKLLEEPFRMVQEQERLQHLVDESGQTIPSQSRRQRL